MSAREVEAAYFALLRAREEVDNLRRYEEFLRAERQRLQRTTREGQALLAQLDRRWTRTIRHTDEPLQEAVDARLRLIDEELGLVPDRLAAAEVHVEDRAREHARLTGGS